MGLLRGTEEKEATHLHEAAEMTSYILQVQPLEDLGLCWLQQEWEQ